MPSHEFAYLSAELLAALEKLSVVSVDVLLVSSGPAADSRQSKYPSGGDIGL
jgi:hypothetical protein